MPKRATVKVHRLYAGRYEVSVNGVRCFDIEHQGPDRWYMVSLNRNLDWWEFAESRKKDVVDFVKRLVRELGPEEVIYRHRERDADWDESIFWERYFERVGR